MTDPSAAGWVATKESGKVAAVWTSSDGGTWSRVAPDDAAFGGPDGQLIFSVVEGVRGWSPSALTAKRGAAV